MLGFMAKLARAAAFVTGMVVLLAGCENQKEPAVPLVGPTTGEAFGGTQCSSVRPQTEPDLMAWDSGSRATLRSVKEQGVVVVHYEAQGCNVQLHVLPNCVAKGTYAFSPYSATETKIAHNANELFAELPVGAAKLSAKLRGSHAIRTDYMMAGVEAVKIGSTFKPDELIGECSDATHVVSKIYVGGFALAAGETRLLEGGASVFVMPAISVGGGAKTESSVEHLQHEGVAKACEEAQEKGAQSPQCAVPLRIALMAIATPVVAPTPAATASNTSTASTTSTTAPTTGGTSAPPSRLAQLQLSPAKQETHHSIHFAADSDKVEEVGTLILDDVVSMMQKNPALKLTIDGHTDNQEASQQAFAMSTLSQHRAQSVQKYLVARGVAADRLTLKPHGPLEPQCSNADDKGRACNRRVEIY